MSYSEPRGYDYRTPGLFGTDLNGLKDYVLDLRVSVFRSVHLGDVLGSRDRKRVT